MEKILDDKKCAAIFGILAVGGTRRLAARYVGCSPATIHNAARRDKDFRRQLRSSNQPQRTASAPTSYDINPKCVEFCIAREAERKRGQHCDQVQSKIENCLPAPPCSLPAA